MKNTTESAADIFNHNNILSLEEIMNVDWHVCKIMILVCEIKNNYRPFMNDFSREMLDYCFLADIGDKISIRVREILSEVLKVYKNVTGNEYSFEV